jgi:restriction endonuclease S subunit
LYYFLKNFNLGSASSIANAINSKIVKKIKLPNIIIQQKIVEILKELDEKIEINSEINN